MSIESEFISKLIETGEYDAVDKAKITAKFFSGSYKTAFRFIQSHKLAYGKVPSARVFSKKFPQIPISPEEELPEPLPYYINEVRVKAKHNMLADAVEKSGEKLAELNTDDAMKAICSAISKIESDFVDSEAVDYCESATSRFESYELRKNCGGIIGMSTMIPPLDYILGGIKEVDFTTVIAPTNTGKAHPLYTPVVTPIGITTIGQLTLGDEVIGGDGKAYAVNGIYPQGIIDVYELTFSDGTTSRCSKEHLWKFRAKNCKNKEWRVETLEQLMKRPLKNGKSWNLSIPVCKPVEFVKPFGILVDLIDPYALGLLIGDGGFTTEQVTFSNPEEDLVARLREILKDEIVVSERKNGIQSTLIKADSSQYLNPLISSLKRLKLWGKYSHEKCIPLPYLRATVEERKKLLLGLMDTDGHVTEKGQYLFSTSSLELRDDFMELCRSLGYRCTFSVDSRSDRPNYIVHISTDDVIVSSEKHLERLCAAPVPRKKHHYDELKIVDIRYVGKEECQCISVNSEEHTYLCNNYIVTHNTWFLNILADKFAKQGYKVGFGTREMSAGQLAIRQDAIGADISYSDLRSGTLSPQDEKKYMDFLKERERKKDYNVVIEAINGGITSIGTFIDRHGFDILLIDGGYLFTDDADDSDWKGIMETFRQFKGLCMSKKVPIITNSQMPSGGKASLSSISFSKALANECDNVLALEQPEDLRSTRQIRVKPLKLRDSGNFCSYICNWDFRSMNYSVHMQEVTDGNFEKPKEGAVKKMSLN